MKKAIRRALVVTIVIAPIVTHAAWAESGNQDAQRLRMRIKASPVATLVPENVRYAHRRIVLHPTVARQIAQAKAELKTTTSQPVKSIKGI